MSELYDLFGGGKDDEIRAIEEDLGRKERKWRTMTERLSNFLMPDSYKRAVEATEYGFEFANVNYPPIPFMRVAGKRYRKKWERKLEVLAERFLYTEGKDDDEDAMRELEDEIRHDFYVTALEYGVPHDIAEVFKIKFKKNYRKVQMCKWVHGESENPREYHERKWDGSTGKINGRPNGLNGYEFPIDKPPVIGWEKDGSEIRGFPGDLPNCSCLIVPVFK